MLRWVSRPRRTTSPRSPASRPRHWSSWLAMARCAMPGVRRQRGDLGREGRVHRELCGRPSEANLWMPDVQSAKVVLTMELLDFEKVQDT